VEAEDREIGMNWPLKTTAERNRFE
jgi:hypothetical protein